MTPHDFIDKWRGSELKESSGSQEHFINLCHLLGEPTPAEADPTGQTYCFERGARKDSGRAGWADVWKRGHFAWEYKGKHANLDRAFDQLRQYALALENPPLLIVSDMVRFRIRTNWTNSVSETHEFELEDLTRAEVREKLKWAMSEPERLRPGVSRQMLTEQTATTFATLAQTLRQRGNDPRVVAQFVNRLVFCMFAEDVDLLPDNMFTRMLERAVQTPNNFVRYAQQLFRAMAEGSEVGFESVAWFNGGLFDDDTALPLEKAEITTVLETASLDWADIDPAILGTLFERGLDPDKRSQLGAHYTGRDMIMRIIKPVVSDPWLAEWEATKTDIQRHLERAESAKTASTRNRRRGQADSALNTFLERLRKFTVLDPACGSGNFLYLALHALKDLEHLVQLEAEELGLAPGLRFVGPVNVKGIEINPYAAELARVSVWVGEIQWMRHNGFPVSRDPILKPLDTIECRDALINTNRTEYEWPEADVIVGNPPFLGDKLMRGRLGDDYVDALRQLYGDQVPGGADLVCFWFAKATQSLAKARTHRAGLVATNSIREGRNRTVLDRIVQQAIIFDAWSDEPWVLDGAAVRVSQVCFGAKADRKPQSIVLNGQRVDCIHADLTADTFDLTRATRLKSNSGVAFRGNSKAGAFDIPGDLAREWLQLPANPNGRTNADVLKPLVNGADLMGRSSDRWIVDFGPSMSEEEAALYEVPFSHVVHKVKPSRLRNRRKSRRERWWIHGEARPNMWRAIQELPRFIVTPETSRHRVFAWLDRGSCPDHQLIVIARDDDAVLGILHSRFHEAWSLRLGSTLEDRPRYPTAAAFYTFPFPDGLNLNVHTDGSMMAPRALAIKDAARNLVILRDRWLNPPEWVEWIEEPVPGYPKRPVPRNPSAASALKQRTLTKLYNERPAWLSHAHETLDTVVAEAYGWPVDISEDDALAALLALNLERS
ncbi:MAG: class I SAM-dependent DNA methyltransferase [Caldilineaceae bacterium SB0661_bin_34]|nr:class I SAM-dependent DNA methyltransferase [Caldilineaceae bacterium SB0661_bin_34]